MEELDLVEILKDCPQGTKLYCSLFGDVELIQVDKNLNNIYPIKVRVINTFANRVALFTYKGTFHNEYENSECVLFPSQNNRDWSTFKVPVEKFNILALKPFDKVLVRDEDDGTWTCGLFSHYDNHSDYKFRCVGCIYIQCIPYNDETKHLLGTTKMPSEKYINW